VTTGTTEQALTIEALQWVLDRHREPAPTAESGLSSLPA
jgi:hypothetical protein